MTDAEMDDLYELYVLGALEPEVMAEVERYINGHPAETRQRLNDAAELAAVMAGMAEQAKPPAELRRRVLATVAPDSVAPAFVAPAFVAAAPSRQSRGWMFASAALAAAFIALAVFSLGSQSDLQQMRDQLHSVGNANSAQQAQVSVLTNERDQLRTALANANRTQQAEVAALTGERDRLRTTLTSATGAQVAAAATLAAEREQFRSTLDAANSSNRAQVEALTGERDQLRTASSRNEAQVTALTREVSQLRTALATAQSAAQVQLAGLTGEVNQLQSAFAILQRPGTRSTPFGAPDAPHGFVFSNRGGGIVFVGSQLPSVASDRTLELWLVPKSGAPRPAGLFRPTNVAGETVHTSALAVNPAEIKALAISDEPSAGSTAPTTKPFLLVPVGG